MYCQEVDVWWGSWCLSSHSQGRSPSIGALLAAFQCLVVGLRGFGALGSVSRLLLSYVCQQQLLRVVTLFERWDSWLTSAGRTALSHRGCCPWQMHRSNQQRSPWQSYCQLLAKCKKIDRAGVRCWSPPGLPIFVIGHCDLDRWLHGRVL